MDFDLDDVFEDFFEEENTSPSTDLAPLAGEIVEINPTQGFGLSTEQFRHEQRTYVSPSLRYIRSLASDNSKETMLYALNRVAKTLNSSDHLNCPWEKLDVDTVQFLKDRLLQDGLSPKTINTYLTSVKQVCKHAWRDKLMPLDTYERIRDIKGVKGTRVSKGRSLEVSEIKSLLQTCKDMSKVINIRDAAIIVLMRSCGLRREEVTVLKKDSINPQTRQIVILGKGNKERKLRIPQSAFPIVHKWIKIKSEFTWRNHEPEAMFTKIHKSGKLLASGLSGQAIHNILEARRQMADLEKFAPHDMRRTFATEMLKKDVAITDVQTMMGHSDVSTTQIYDRRDDERILDIMDDSDIFA
ncbi:tyrosine-type recombinase/integrase [Vibrio crassostreae]|uniref:tyrosine-type recombinase/integrase n=1 Tax=Vibrio crassostreae TaxID=246167 RepID=UPI001B31442F|nr:tyrosine-type recombinase/integrase [Vibrio crassostreae]